MLFKDMYGILIFILSLWGISTSKRNCITGPSITKVTGSRAPSAKICSKDLIFKEDFDEFDLAIWSHENTLAGGGNWEFQWYTNNRSNSFVKNGILHIKPTLVSDDFGEKFLYSGTVDVNGPYPQECTEPRWYGCLRTGNNQNILNPIKSAKITTLHSFSFKYGKLEVSAKLPRGDWLWPAIWLLPRYNQYSTWPSSGEIDVMEGRGNENLFNANNENIGVQQIGSTLHWGPNTITNLYNSTTFAINNAEGFDKAFHRYQMEWNKDEIKFSVDDEDTFTVKVPEGGFWELGNLSSTNYDNPWKTSSKIAPFDQQFFLIINLAVGGINYFPDGGKNNGKPWKNNSTKAATDFWKGRHQWLPSWDLIGERSTFQIDYVKVWAL